MCWAAALRDQEFNELYYFPISARNRRRLVSITVAGGMVMLVIVRCVKLGPRDTHTRTTKPN